MITVPAGFEEFITYLAESATPQQILDFQLSDAAQERARELVEAAQSRQLTLEEMLELEQMRHFDSVVSRLRSRALARIEA